MEESWSSKEDAHTKRKTRKWLSSPTYTYVNPVDVLDGEYWHRICVSQATATNGAVFMETKSSISEAVSLQNITTGQRSNWFDIDRHSLKPLNFYERHENRRVERNGWKSDVWKAIFLMHTKLTHLIIIGRSLLSDLAVKTFALFWWLAVSFFDWAYATTLRRKMPTTRWYIRSQWMEKVTQSL